MNVQYWDRARDPMGDTIWGGLNQSDESVKEARKLLRAKELANGGYWTDRLREKHGKPVWRWKYIR